MDSIRAGRWLKDCLEGGSQTGGASMLFVVSTCLLALCRSVAKVRHDSVYALQALFGGRMKVEVDYTEPVEQVFADATFELISLVGCLNILTQACTAGLASWIIDFSMPHSSAPRKSLVPVVDTLSASPDSQNDVTNTELRVSAQASMVVHRHGLTGLRIRAFVLGSLTSVTRGYVDGQSITEIAHVRNLLTQLRLCKTIASMKSLLLSIASLMATQSEGHIRYSIISETVICAKALERVWRKILEGRAEQRARLVALRRTAEAVLPQLDAPELTKHLGEIRSQMDCIDDQLSKIENDRPFADHDLVRESIANFIDSMDEQRLEMLSRTQTFTIRGWIGFVHADAPIKVGDKAIIIASAGMPLCVTSNGLVDDFPSFQLVANCYIHEIMDGQAVRAEAMRLHADESRVDKVFEDALIV